MVAELVASFQDGEQEVSLRCLRWIIVHNQVQRTESRRPPNGVHHLFNEAWGESTRCRPPVRGNFRLEHRFSLQAIFINNNHLFGLRPDPIYILRGPHPNLEGRELEIQRDGKGMDPRVLGVPVPDEKVNVVPVR
jgi:hypothetical protein